MDAFLATPAPLPLDSLPAWVDVSAMAVAAAFGAATGRNRRLPLLAVLAAGVIAGLVGGMIRDALLGLETAAIENWYYIPAVLLAALAGGFLTHRLIQGHVPYQLARALAVGLLVTIGVQKGIEYQAPADAAIFLGIVTGTMGGSTADVMAGERAAIFRRAHWGLAAIILSAFIFWLLTTYVNFWVAIVAAVLTVASLELISVRLGWNSPMFPGDMTTPETGPPEHEGHETPYGQSGPPPGGSQVSLPHRSGPAEP